MGILNDISKKAQEYAGIAVDKAKDLAEVAADKAQTLSDTAKTNMAIMNLSLIHISEPTRPY